MRGAAAVKGAERADRGRRGGQRLPDRRPGRAVAPHDRGLRGLPAAARAEGAAVRRLRVVLPDGDAAHPRRRDVDGPVPGQAHHPAGPAAGRGRARDRRRPPRSPRRARDRRRVRRARRGVQQHGRGTGGEPARSSNGRRSISSASTSKAKVRRRYIETILERIATGVVSIDAQGAIGTVNDAGRPAARPRARRRRPRAPRRSSRARTWRRWPRCCGRRASLRGDDARRRKWRCCATAAICTWRPWRRRLPAKADASQGRVLVFDDVTPLIRSQKVAAWREVARRLAHEIKNPLTPIQLSAERLRRHFGAAPPPTRRFVDECTTTIVAEVESLKGLVDEFSQFARMPAPKAVPTALHAAARRHAGAVRRPVRRGASSSGAMPPTCRSCAWTPSRSGASSSTWSTMRSKRWSGAGGSRSRPATTRPTTLVRIVIADDGPGISDRRS